LAVIFFINLQPRDLGRRIREKLLGLPLLCRYDTGVSSPLVAAGIEWFHPLLGGCVLTAPTASQTMDETSPQNDPRWVRTPDLAIGGLGKPQY